MICVKYASDLEMVFMGAMDKRAMAQGKEAIDTEIQRIKELLSVGRFVPFTDHLIPSDVSWDNYCNVSEYN